MRPNEAFKLGFLTRCVEEGLSPEDTVKLVKSASDCFNKESGIVSDTIGTAGKAIGSLGMPALIGAAALPPAQLARGRSAALRGGRAADVPRRRGAPRPSSAASASGRSSRTSASRTWCPRRTWPSPLSSRASATRTPSSRPTSPSSSRGSSTGW